MSLLPRVLTRAAALRRARTWVRNDRGAAAIEFALVAIPFFMFVLGIIGIGLYFFTSHALDLGVEAAARQIRTGQAQKGDVTVDQFKQLVCGAAGTYINCDKVHVLVQNAPNWTGITPTSCVTDNSMTPSTGSSGELISKYSGGASSVALVTVCYEWDLAQMFGFLHLGKNSDGSGSAVLQAATAFRIEPYT